MELKIKSWSQCSINNYYRIVDIIEDDALDDNQKRIGVLAVLCDCSEEDIYELTVTEVHMLMEKMSFIYSFDFDKNIKFKKITIGDIDFIINTNLNTMNMEQYIDFQSYWGKNDLKTYYGNILACFLIPSGKKYNRDYDVVEMADFIRDNLSIKVANEVCFFFLKEYLNSIKAMEVCLDWMLRWKMKKEKDPAVKMKLGRGIILNRQRTQYMYGYLSSI